MEVFMAALTKASKTRLIAASEPWVQRVYKDIVPQGSGGTPITRPYVVCMFVGGGNTATIRADFVNCLWQIKAVANDQDTAYDCKARISTLFNNADYGSAKALDGGTDWWINSVKEERAIDLTELVDGNRIYHAGAVFRVLMQAKQVI